MINAYVESRNENEIRWLFVAVCNFNVEKGASSSRKCFPLIPPTDINYQANVEITRVVCSPDYISSDLAILD